VLIVKGLLRFCAAGRSTLVIGALCHLLGAAALFRGIVGWFFGLSCALLPTLAFGLVVNDYTAARDNRFSSGYPTSPVANADPSFIGSGYDWSGVGWRADDASRSYVLLDARHFLYANHYPAGVGATIDFTPANGVVKGYTVQDQSGSLLGPLDDLAVGTLAAPIPKSDNVHPLPIFFQGYQPTPYLNANLLQYGHWSTVGWNRIKDLSQFQGYSGYYWDYGFDATTPDRAALAGGDSGSPSFIVTGVPGQIYVAGAHWSAAPLDGFDTAVPRMLPTISNYTARTGYLPYVVTPVTALWRSSSSGDWSVNDNWSPHSVPVDVFLSDLLPPRQFVLSTAASVLFDGAAPWQRTISLEGDQSVTGITFNSAANVSGSNGFTFSAGSTLTIGEAGLSNRDDDVQTFNCDVALRASQRWDVGRGGLTVGGPGTSIDTGGTGTGGFLLLVDGDGNTTLAGRIAGVGGLAKDGAGTLTLSNSAADPNSYRGKTFINGGTLALSRDDQLGTAPASFVADQLSINGGTLQATNPADVLTLAANRGVTLGSLGGTIAIDTGKTLTGASVIAGPGAPLSKAGGGNLVLTAANTYSGATAVQAGTLSLSGAGGTATGSSALTVYHGATLQLDNSAGNNPNRIADGAAINLFGGTFTFLGRGSASSSETVGTLTPQIGASTVGISGGAPGNAATLAVAALGARNSTTNVGGTVNFLTSANNSMQLLQGSDPRLSGILGGYAVVNGTDWATVTGSASPWPIAPFSSYTEMPASLPGGGNAVTNYIISSSDKTLDTAFEANSLKLSGAAPRTLNLAGFNLTTNTSGPNIFGVISDGGNSTGHTITGGGGIFASGAGELVTYVNGGTLTINAPILGPGGGALTKSGPGTLILGSPGNSFSGATTVTAGTLTFAAGATSTASSLLVTGAAHFDLAGYNQTVANITIRDSGSVQNTGTAAALSLAGNAGTVSYSGVSGGGTVSVDTLNLAAAGAAAGSHTFTVGNGLPGGQLTVTSVIADGTTAGAQSLLKAGSGTLTLSGSNSYTGSTTISAGTLALGNSNALAGTAGVTINGGTLALGTYSPSVAAVTLQSGTISGAGTLTAGAFELQSGTVSAALAGTLPLGLIKSTAGAVTLSGANTYSGGTNVNAGTLSVGSDASLGNSSGALNFNGGTLQITGTGFTSTARAINWSSSGGGFDIGGDGIAYASGVDAPSSFTLSQSQPLAGTGPLTKLGMGVLQINGTVGSSAINIQDGTLYLSAASPLTNSSVAVTISNPGILQLDGQATITSLALSGGQVKTGTGKLILGGDLSYLRSIWPATISGNLDLGGATRTFNVAAGSSGTDLTVSAIISNTYSGGNGLVKAGAGSLLLSGNNTYSGGTLVQAGVLRFQTTAALPATSTITVQSGGYAGVAVAMTQAFLDKFDKANMLGTVGLDADSSGVNLAANGGFNAAARLGSSTAATLSGTFTPQGIQYRFGGGGGTLTVTSVLGDNGGSYGLDMGSSTSESGSVLLPGVVVLNAANTYTGTTTVSAGTLRLGNFGGLGTTDGGTVVNPGAVLDLNGLVVGNDSWPQNETVTISGSGLGGLGVVIDTNNVAGGLSGNVILAGDSTVGTLGTLNGGGHITLSGVISGGYGLTKVGPATLTLGSSQNTSDNTYGGTTTVSVGTLKLAKPGALGSTANGTSVWNGATLDLNGQAVGNENVTIAGAGIYYSGSGYTGAITNSSSTPASLAGSVTLAAGGYVGGSGTITLSGQVSGNYGLTKVGTNTLILSGANSYTGVTTLNSGTLQLGNSQALQNSTLDYNYAGLLSFGSLAGSTFGGLKGSQNLPLQNASSAAVALSVGNNNADTAYSGVLSGSGSLTKIGTGTLALSGTNSAYSGVTTVNAGTLRLGNPLALGTTAQNTVVNSGAALDLGGQAVGDEPVTINGTGIGNSGALTNSNASVAASLSGALTLGSPSTIAGAGSITLTGPLNANYDLTKLGSGTLAISGAQNWGGSASLLIGNTGGLAPSGLDAPSGGLVLGGDVLGGGPAVAPTGLMLPSLGATVPEPAGLAMLIGAGVGWLLWRGWRRLGRALRR
jgi:autotransporter-associated beta strand protein